MLKFLFLNKLVLVLCKRWCTCIAVSIVSVESTGDVATTPECHLRDSYASALPLYTFIVNLPRHVEGYAQNIHTF